MAGLVPAIPLRQASDDAAILSLYSRKPARRRAHVGVTNDLVRRVYEHKTGIVKGFTSRYGIDRLVHFEMYDAPYSAIQREKNIKHWPRAWKTRLTFQANPTWRDLYEEIAGP